MGQVQQVQLARDASQRISSIVKGDLIACVSDLAVADDDTAFLSVVKTTLKHGGVSVGELAKATQYGDVVIHNILCSEDRVPPMNWAREEYPRRHIFACIRKLLESEEEFRAAA